jgi:hypothetical protein
MRFAAILASLLVLLLSVVWLAAKPGFDSAVAVAAAIATLLSSFFLKRSKSAEGQTQNVSGSSIGVQAGRDANIDKVNKR